MRDDDGNFVLGPNVQHDTARNYIQHFDTQGHPKNLASEASQRRLIRAQNDALSTVGVVVRKAEMNRSPWQTMSDEQKHLLLLDENIAGANCGIAENIIQKLSTRWITCLRRRLLTYKSYLGMSLPETILSEWGSLGFRAFFLPGLPFAAVTSVSQSLRDSILDDDRVPALSHASSKLHSSSLVRVIGAHSLRILWFAAEYPFYTFSVLQSLYLIPVDANPPLLALVPFTSSSPIQFPETDLNLSWLSLTSHALNVVSSPFVLGYIKDQIGKYIFSKVYLIVRYFLVKPDRPDRLSLQSAKDNMNIIPDGAIPGMAVDRRDDRHSSGLETVIDIARTLFPAVFWLWEKVLQTQRTPLTVELSPSIETELLNQSIMHYRDLLRQDREVDVELRRAPRTLRIMAIRAAFNDYNLDPDHAMMDIFELAEGMNFLALSDVSTATPEPLEPPPIIDGNARAQSENIAVNGGEIGTPSGLVEATSDQPPGIERSQSSNSSVRDHEGAENGALDSGTDSHARGEPSSRPAVPLETLLPTVPPDAEMNQSHGGSNAGPELSIQGSQVPNSPRPFSPVPGIARAATLPNTGRRPVRRPTDLSEELRPTREDLFYQQHPSRKSRYDSGPLYRVTLLSNHPAETLALIGASIVESAMLLPFDMLFLRSLARSFLANGWGDMQASSAARPLADEWPLGSWFGVRSLDASRCFRFFGAWSMTLGIQALVNFVIWNASTRITLGLGSRFGWGKI
ncbi:hypothetical protein A1O3_08768 [Capronia epimyces CBS 606.96]|uniref:Uncharacterized protein n=1 Tax=Capronia epimyces CBS 606.96 TaxID=1182542 RepID=W9XFI3_9EURO|nr:uncharacterized protein A1O3_08768 [Capronia epimyces CBS 606.96]EXJ79267.1 hypothetical protein A1O3_08768 [Capronia epimyces CBS 606.96]